MKRLIAAVMTAAALATTVATIPAEAQQQSGLVNVYVDDVLTNNNVTVQVAANVAATVCGITAQVGVIAEQIQRTGNYQCTSATGQTVQVTRNR